TGSGITGSGTFTVEGSSTLDVPLGTSISTSSGTTVIENTGADIISDGTFTSNGEFDWTGGRLDGTGSVNIPSGVPFNISGPDGKNFSKVTINNAGTAVWSGLGGITGDAGSTLNNTGSFTIQNDETMDTFTGVVDLNNSGTLTKSGGTGITKLNVKLNNTGSVNASSGTLTLESFSQSSGTLNLDGGAVVAPNGLTLGGGSLVGAGTITGDVTNGGTISPGSASAVGTIAITGKYTQTSAGTVNIKVGSASGVPQYDQLNSTNAAALGGTLNVTILGTAPLNAPPLMVMNFSSETGGFDHINPPAAVNGQGVTVSVGPTFVAVVSLSSGAVAFIPAGLSMISVPYNYTAMGGIDAAVALGLPMMPGGRASIATYDPVTNRYLFYPDLPPDPALTADTGTDLLAGRGYWIMETTAQPFTKVGNPSQSPLNITLQPGWNMIGDPYTSAIDMTDPADVEFTAPVAVGSIPANMAVPLDQAITAGIVGSPFFTWNQTMNSYVTDTVLRPWYGYWVYISPTATQNQPVTLTFTNPNP
ncbi:MAG TPA: hypothetical protein VFJ58_21020, partial [Armatimonadota bacterium]|nr:hypothetical protein [Armatimonadota bacterium]